MLSGIYKSLYFCRCSVCRVSRSLLAHGEYVDAVALRGLWAALFEPEAVDVLADDELEAHVVLQASLGHLSDEALHALGVGDGGVLEEGVDVGGYAAAILAVDGGVEVGQGRGRVAEGGELADEFGFFAGFVVAAGGEELLLYLLEFEGTAARGSYAVGRADAPVEYHAFPDTIIDIVAI